MLSLAREHHTQLLPHLFSLSQLLTKLLPPLAGTEAPPYLCLQLVSEERRPLDSLPSRSNTLTSSALCWG